MEVNEALRRILGGHTKLVLALVVAGLGIGLAVRSGHSLAIGQYGVHSCSRWAFGLTPSDPPLYSATTRVVLDTANPKAEAESAAIASTARAIVTSPAHVAAALAKVGIRRDAATVAACDIKLQPLGSSAILQISARDFDPMRAAALANAIADDLIETRLETSRGQAVQLVSDLDTRIQALDASIGDLDSQVAALVKSSLAAPPPANDFTARAVSADAAAAAARAAQTANSLSALRTRRGDMATEKVALEAERENLLAAGAIPPKPTVIDPATPPVGPDPTQRLTYVALGLLLGLTAGVGIAALLETVRPTVIGQRALGTALGAPVLGELPFRLEGA
ncbi:MAG: hypothetical protein E6J01_09475 [Chloroflexi bacterium]|nr:MAG: hypothetical protein E6J01_09475 [Chloroflexota bacterium]